MEKVTDIRFAGLRTLSCVIERGSLSAAAQELGLTPSAVSKQITRLEDDLGVRLLERTTRRVRPTPAGLAMHDKTRGLLDGLEETFESIVNDAGTVQGTVRISATPAFGSTRLLATLARVSQSHPRLNFEVTLSDKRLDFIEDEIDLAVREGALEDSCLRARLLEQSNVVFCASPGYLQKHGVPQRMEDLAGHQLLMIPKTGPANHPSRWLEKSGVSLKPSPHFVVNDLFALRYLAVYGAGIAALPDYVVEEALACGELQRVLADLPPFQLPISAVYPSNRHMPLRVRVVIDALAGRD